MTIAVETTFNPSTCERSMAVATYPLAETPGTAWALARGGPAASREPVVVPSADGDWYVRLNAFVRDPVDIHVSEARADFLWNSSGPVAWWNDRSWYSYTGWYETAYWVGNSATGANTTGHYQNEAFCIPWESTFSRHWETRTSGWTSGHWEWSYSMGKWGRLLGPSQLRVLDSHALIIAGDFQNLITGLEQRGQPGHHRSRWPGSDPCSRGLLSYPPARLLRARVSAPWLPTVRSAVDLAAAGVAYGHRDAVGLQPTDELALIGRVGRGPFRAGGRVERDQVHMDQPQSPRFFSSLASRSARQA